MDVNAILHELKDQALYLDQAIQALQRLTTQSSTQIQADGSFEKRRRGRPRGSKSKVKTLAVAAAA